MKKATAKAIRKKARQATNRTVAEVTAQAAAWRALPWWKRAALRIRWVFTGELRRAS